jgi:hypothetical protein
MNYTDVGGAAMYKCMDNYCPPEMPTLREFGICEEKLSDCYKMSMKLTVKLSSTDYRYYCLLNPSCD